MIRAGRPISLARAIAPVAMLISISSCVVSTGMSPRFPSADSTQSGPSSSFLVESLPNGWRLECIRGTSFAIGLPIDWRNDGPPQPVSSGALVGMSDKERRSTTWFNLLLQARAVRLLAVGQIPGREASDVSDGAILVYVRSGDSSQEAAVAETVRQGLDAYGAPNPIAVEPRLLSGQPGSALLYEGSTAAGGRYLEDVSVSWRDERQTLVIATNASEGAAKRSIVTPFAQTTLATLRKADCP